MIFLLFLAVVGATPRFYYNSTESGVANWNAEWKCEDPCICSYQNEYCQCMVRIDSWSCPNGTAFLWLPSIPANTMESANLGFRMSWPYETKKVKGLVRLTMEVSTWDSIAQRGNVSCYIDGTPIGVLQSKDYRKYNTTNTWLMTVENN